MAREARVKDKEERDGRSAVNIIRYMAGGSGKIGQK